MKTITNIIYFAFASLAFACFALAPEAGATCQDGCLTNNNTVLGDDALVNNTTGIDHTAIGLEALFSNVTGSFNIAVGNNAAYDLTTGSFNIALGFQAGFNLTTGSNNIDIGNGGVAGESKTIR